MMSMVIKFSGEKLKTHFKFDSFQQRTVILNIVIYKQVQESKGSDTRKQE